VAARYPFFTQVTDGDCREIFIIVLFEWV